MLAVLDGLRGENLVWTDLDAWRRGCWRRRGCSDAALRRSLPSTVEVRGVASAQPIGIGRIGGELYLVDEHGVVIDQYGPHTPSSTCRSSTAWRGRGRDRRATDEARAALAARVIASLRAEPEIAGRLSQVDVSDVHNAKVILNGDPAVIYVGEDRFLPRIELYLQLAAALRERVPESTTSICDSTTDLCAAGRASREDG